MNITQLDNTWFEVVEAKNKSKYIRATFAAEVGGSSITLKSNFPLSDEIIDLLEELSTLPLISETGFELDETDEKAVEHRKGIYKNEKGKFPYDYYEVKAYKMKEAFGFSIELPKMSAAEIARKALENA